MKTHLLLFAVLMFASPVMYAQNTIEAYNTGVLAGRSSTPMIADGIGEDARFESITAIWGDGSNLYVADSIAVRQLNIASQEVTTLAGAFGAFGTIDGPLESARFRFPTALWGDGATLYVGDLNLIRAISLDTGMVRTVAALPTAGTLHGLWGNGNSLYTFAVTGSPLARLYFYRVAIATGEISAVVHMFQVKGVRLIIFMDTAILTSAARSLSDQIPRSQIHLGFFGEEKTRLCLQDGDEIARRDVAFILGPFRGS